MSSEAAAAFRGSTELPFGLSLQSPSQCIFAGWDVRSSTALPA